MIADPVLMCNNLGAPPLLRQPNEDSIISDGRSSTSLKEAVRIAQNNNFMGLVCCSRILDAVPALVEAIKVAGLVLVSDASSETNTSLRRVASPSSPSMLEGVAGVLLNDGVMRFTETVEV